MPIPPDTRAPGDAGHITDHNQIADELTALAGGAVTLAGDLTGTAGAAQVTATHLGSPLPLAQGGTGQTAQAAALTALAGTQSAGKVLRSDGTATTLAAIQAGDLPLSQLDARYVLVFSPMAYGAVGNGIADDTVALQNCCAAAAAVAGVVDLGTRTFKTTAPVNVTTNFHLRGAGTSYIGGGIVNSASDMFTFASSGYFITFENCCLTSNVGGGHIWNASNASLSAVNILDVQATQNNPGKGIWYQANGALIDCLVDRNCNFSGAVARQDSGCSTSTVTPNTVLDSHAVPGDAGLPISNAAIPPGTIITGVTNGVGYTISGAGATATVAGAIFSVGGATVAPWSVLACPGVFNSVQFKRMRCLNNNSSAVPFFNLDPGFGAHSDSVTMAAASTTVLDTSAVTQDLSLGFFVYSSNFPGGKSKITAVTPGTSYTVATPATANLTATCMVGSQGWYQNVTFDGITFEQCIGGCIYMTGMSQVTLEQCIHWDAITLANTFSFQQSITGYVCADVVLRQCGDLHSGTGWFTVAADTGTQSILMDSCGVWGIPALYSTPAGQTTVLNPVSASGTGPVTSIPGPLAVRGASGATTGMRLAGATASGAPVTGTFLTGDVILDLTGVWWICTAGGTPGTWASAGAAAPNIQLFNASGTWTRPSGAKTVFASVLASAGGAGSGASGASGTALSGGAGGGAGAFLQRQFIATDLTSTVNVIVGAAGTGGASVTGTSGTTAGNAGVTGGASYFGLYLSAAGGGPGAGGLAAAIAAGGYGQYGLVDTNLGTGASSLANGGAGVGTSSPISGPPGGPSGGGITAAGAASAGAVGIVSPFSGDATRGAAGVVGGASPTSGTASALTNGSMGPSAGSGAASTSGAAQGGADALANTGAGGAGGGASLNGNASGAGGKGGAGWVLVISYFQLYIPPGPFECRSQFYREPVTIRFMVTFVTSPEEANGHRSATSPPRRQAGEGRLRPDLDRPQRLQPG